MPYLEISDVSAWYGTTQALHDVSLAVERGELFTLLGPSGSGKSTLLLAVAGFEPPLVAGSIYLEGQDIVHVPPNKRDFGMVFQSYELWPHLRVYDNVAYALNVRGVAKPEKKRRVEELLDKVKLTGYARRYPKQLSGGQQQRVALARAMVFSPRMLLLDEPLGALDKKLRERMQFEIRHLTRELGSTVLYVTHDQTEALAISDRIAVLREGYVEQIGTPREIYEEPASAFVADFVGGANFLDVTISSMNETTCDVDFSGKTIRGVPRPDWADQPNTKALLMIRPEHSHVSANSSSEHEDIQCEITQRYYVGNATLLHCRLGASTQLTVRDSSMKTPLPCGNEAFLHVDSASARLFTRDSRPVSEPTKGEQ